ncbi:MAG: tRNA 5-hydroxyuridine modification protein YegQ [Alphaproteobacteria bacterium]|nr:tRNA 5-hydroxyuridine modification protein YegQ [Alphaproteobacteria bacterium]MCB1551686.1 tRNA 5-hydroxyuridine modification protein YegQ [Alphaproteobacteria bacterium]MCB9985426.1 tRNA 5-hydroxyuridine modification protein YegQ [Micavibrio sp.]HPQ50480.1 tRNA 5-hydroxyuridine modification protein YegQ [Alphaproteobacteria bacterium]
MKKPELLAPAGSMKMMEYAFAYGADAVYAGQPKYSLRVRNNSFKKDENLANGIEIAHAQGKKFFVAANLFPHNGKVRTFLNEIEPVIDMKPDGLIMADPGLIMMVREKWPDVPIHLSVQMNTVNFASVKFWQKLGLTRIILSRELSLKEIAEIRQECPDMEIEVFIHGALCIAYSGRCLLSGYFNHRDANQGSCTNACRWKYNTTSACETEEGLMHPEDVLPQDALQQPEMFSECGSLDRHPMADNVYFLEEQNRAGEFMPVFEDEQGTYIMNSKDLRAIEHVHKLIEIGVDCLKIEGRTKSHYYAARTSQCYRQAIDQAIAGQPLDPKLIGILENLAHRGYTDGFYQRHHSQDHQNYMAGASDSHKQQFVGEMISRKDNWMEIDVKNKFSVGDRLEIILPNGQNREMTLTDMKDKKGNAIETAPGNGHIVHIPANDIDSDIVLISRFL